MKRRNFIWLTTAAATSISIPILSCSSELNFVDTLSVPTFLSKIYNAETIFKIGNLYQELVQTEANKDILINLIVEDINMNKITNSFDRIQLQEFLMLKIKNEFKINKTIIIDGWILSKTEARQCALFTLINN